MKFLHFHRWIDDGLVKIKIGGLLAELKHRDYDTKILRHCKCGQYQEMYFNHSGFDSWENIKTPEIIEKI